MWAAAGPPCDDERPIDLRKKTAVQRDILSRSEEEHCWKTSLPLSNLYPLVSERYGGWCSLAPENEVRQGDHRLSENRTPEYAHHAAPKRPDFRSDSSAFQETKQGHKGALEATIRKLHHNRQLRDTSENSKEERCKSTGLPELTSKKLPSPTVKRSTSCPNLAVVKSPRPSAIKPKSSFMQRLTLTHQTDDAQVTSTTGAKKRKSFVPVYGDRSPKKRPPSPVDQEEYFSHPEVILRRQLQQTPAGYLVHVYDYYQQLVQRLREQPPGIQPSAPVSPTSIDDEGDVQRKRPCRALTGKHVRQGTGASLSTLLTLRQKIQERQKAKEDEPRNGYHKMASAKKAKSQKPKLVLGKRTNC